MSLPFSVPTTTTIPAGQDQSSTLPAAPECAALVMEDVLMQRRAQTVPDYAFPSLASRPSPLYAPALTRDISAFYDTAITPGQPPLRLAGEPASVLPSAPHYIQIPMHAPRPTRDIFPSQDGEARDLPFHLHAQLPNVSDVIRPSTLRHIHPSAHLHASHLQPPSHFPSSSTTVAPIAQQHIHSQPYNTTPTAFSDFSPIAFGSPGAGHDAAESTSASEYAYECASVLTSETSARTGFPPESECLPDTPGHMNSHNWHDTAHSDALNGLFQASSCGSDSEPDTAPFSSATGVIAPVSQWEPTEPPAVLDRLVQPMMSINLTGRSASAADSPHTSFPTGPSSSILIRAPNVPGHALKLLWEPSIEELDNFFRPATTRSGSYDNASGVDSASQVNVPRGTRRRKNKHASPRGRAYSVCSECHKTMRAAERVSHYLGHKGLKRVACECNEMFCHVSDAFRHVREHTRCPVCGRTVGRYGHGRRGPCPGRMQSGQGEGGGEEVESASHTQIWPTE